MEESRSERKQHALDMFGRLPAYYDREWPLQRQAEAWRAAGIRDVRVRRMSLGGGVGIWGTVGG